MRSEIGSFITILCTLYHIMYIISVLYKHNDNGVDEWVLSIPHLLYSYSIYTHSSRSVKTVF